VKKFDRDRESYPKFGDIVAVDRVSLRVGDSEVFGLVGQNGAGKTITVRKLDRPRFDLVEVQKKERIALMSSLRTVSRTCVV
jgi:ABC-type uncharacterized transport system ATPase subunit